MSTKARTRPEFIAAAMVGDFRHAVDDKGVELPLWRGIIPSNQVKILSAGERQWLHLAAAKARWD